MLKYVSQICYSCPSITANCHNEHCSIHLLLKLKAGYLSFPLFFLEKNDSHIAFLAINFQLAICACILILMLYLNIESFFHSVVSAIFNVRLTFAIAVNLLKKNITILTRLLA